MILKNGKRLDGMGDSMPIGSVIEYNGTDIPDGWEILPGDANVYVGSDLPTDKQEVWIKRGKNLISNNFFLWEPGHYAMEDGFKSSYKGRVRFSQLIPVSPNTTYYCNTFKEGYAFVIRAYDENKNFTYSIGGISDTNVFTTNSSAYYIGVAIYGLSNEDTTFKEYVSLLLSESITPLICLNSCDNKDYEPYIPREIRLKNTNSNAYEIFYCADDYGELQYSESETIIGKWLNGSPLYKRTYVVPSLGDVGTLTVPFDIDDLHEVVNMYGSATNGATFFTLPSYRGAPGLGIIIYADRNNGFTIEKESNRTDYWAYLTIEYTKRID
jgi:hypothetical protein